jgi:hypothetical protein
LGLEIAIVIDPDPDFDDAVQQGFTGSRSLLAKASVSKSHLLSLDSDSDTDPDPDFASPTNASTYDCPVADAVWH